MDTDTIFLTSPLKVWEHFNKMDGMQMAAVAPEHEDFSTGWYNRFARHPYYGNLGNVLCSKVNPRTFINFIGYLFFNFRCKFGSDVDEFDKNAAVWLGKICRSHIS